MKPIDYCVALAEGRIAPPKNFDLATIQQQELAMTFRFHIHQYLSRRAADWKERGFTETLVDFAALMRAQNTGVTISAPPSKTGRTSRIRVIRSVAARGRRTCHAA